MKTKTTKRSSSFAAAVGRALRRSARVARKTARIHGTPIYIWRDGIDAVNHPYRNYRTRSLP